MAVAAGHSPLLVCWHGNMPHGATAIHLPLMTGIHGLMGNMMMMTKMTKMLQYTMPACADQQITQYTAAAQMHCLTAAVMLASSHTSSIIRCQGQMYDKTMSIRITCAVNQRSALANNVIQR
jgi:hypothetical protein